MAVAYEDNEQTIDLGFTAWPAQVPFCQSPARYKLAGGAMGGGKTALLAAVCGDLLVTHPGNVGYLARIDLPSLSKTTLKEFLKQFPRELIVQHHVTEQWIDVATADPRHPSRLYYGGLETPGRILSLNLGFFIVDEAFEVPKSSFDALATRLRLRLPDGTYPPYCGLLSSNPAPCWLMDYFPVLPAEKQLYDQAVRLGGDRFQRFKVPGSEQKYIDPDYAYFPFGAKDNPANPPDYEDNLRRLYADDPVTLARYVEGEWGNMMQGLVYNFQPLHRWKARHPGERLYKPGVPVQLAGDPSGGAAPYAVLVLQEQGERVCIVDEFYQEGGTDEDFREWLRGQPYAGAVIDGIFDPAAATSITRLQRFGLPVRGLTKQKNIMGHIACVKGIMRPDAATGYAPLLIDENFCLHLVAELGLYSYRKLREDDMKAGVRPSETPEDKNNHAINALEYWTAEKRPTAQGGGMYRKPPVRRRAAYLNLVG